MKKRELTKTNILLVLFISAKGIFFIDVMAGQPVQQEVKHMM
jgi:hypothetical protein